MRMTRAAIRAQAQAEELSQPNSTLIHEDVSDHETPPMQEQDAMLRPALRDITDENYPQFDSSATYETEKMVPKKEQRKAKSQAPVKKTIQIEARSIEPNLVIDSPVILSDTDKGESQHEEQEMSNIEAQIHDDLGETIQAYTPVKELTLTASKTPKFDPDVHAPPDASLCNFEEDSFIDSIKTRSPVKSTESQSDFDSVGGSSCDNTLSRTSSTRRSIRIEDSVEEIDALEDAIEKFTEGLPILQPKPASPVKDKSISSCSMTPRSKQASSKPQTPRTNNKQSAAPNPYSVPRTKTPRTAGFQNKETSPVPKQKSPIPLKNSVSKPNRSPVKSAVSKTPITPKPSAIVSRPSPSKQTQQARREVQPTKPKSAVNSRASTVKPTARAVSKSMPSGKAMEEEPTRPGLSFSASPVKQQQTAVKKRVTSGGILSTSKPAFVPAKSTKPTTTSTFVLPGEAIAAKLKAQREERLAREQAAEQEKSKAFKARPAPKFAERPSVVPRENKASQARINAITSGSNKENVAPHHNRSSSSATKLNTLAVAKTRPVSMPPPSKSEPSALRKASAVLTGASHARIASLSSGQRLAVTKEDTVNQKAKGKQVFNRARANLEQEQKEKREKEEAARKARAEAAERGRQASREWAEKQKKKMAADSVSNAKKTDEEAIQLAVESARVPAPVTVS